MTSLSPLTVLLPDTLIPVAAGRALPDAVQRTFAPAPAFSRLMARGRWSSLVREDGDPLEQWLWRAVSEAGLTAAGTDGGDVADANGSSMTRKTAPTPAWAMLGAPDAKALSRWWVSPVHVAIGREGVSLLTPDALALSDAEAQAFAALLCDVAGQAGWTLVLSASAASTRSPSISASPQFGCLMQTDSPLPVTLPSPWALARQRMTDLLPTHPGMSDWRRLWMELQMVLHDHPLNRERQARGLPVVNAFWWWGGGETLSLPNDFSLRLVVTDLADVDAGAGAPRPAASPMASPMASTAPTTPGPYSRVLSPSAVHRCAAWLGSYLSVSGPAPALSLHLVDSANPAIWSAGAARHPAIQWLESDLIGGLSATATPHRLVLLGQSGWREVHSSAALRLAFWKNRPQVDDVLEPVDGLLEEDDLARAWQESAHRSTPDEGEFHPERF